MPSVIRSLIGWAKRSLENPSTPLSAPDDWLYDALGSYRASSGVNVNRETALTYASVWRAVNLLTRDVARTPLLVHKRLKSGRKLARKHYAFRLLRRKPNEAMTAFAFKQCLMAHVLLAGNAYAYIERDGAGRPLCLLPLSPDRTYPVREIEHSKDGRQVRAELLYVTTVDQGLRKLLPENVLHIKGLSYDGLVGYNVITKARESLGEGMAQQTWGSIFYRNNGRPGVVLQHPGRLSEMAAKNLRESWERIHTGIENAHRVAVLQEGMQLKDFGFSAEDSQFIESRKFTRVEVANWFSLPPHKLGDGEKAAYNSLEQENQSYLDESLGPWFTAWEEECWDKLLSEEEKERETHEVEFNRRHLVQADMKDRGAYYTQALTGGWMNQDEVRAEEGYNRIPDGRGETFRAPLNTAPVDGKEADAAGNGEAGAGQGRQAPTLDRELLAVPDIRQTTAYDCGAAATRAVAQYFGVDDGASEQAFMAALGTTPEAGTSPDQIIAYLNSKKLLTTSSQDLAVEDLDRFFLSGHPVICCIQYNGSDEEAAANQSGHWVVVIGVGLGQVFFQDPVAGRQMWPVEKWLKAWHDESALADGSAVVLQNYGIAVGEELVQAPAEPEEKPKGDADEKGGKGPGTLDPDAGQDDDAGGEDPQRSVRILTPLQAVLKDAVGRMIRRLGVHLRRAAKDPARFLGELDKLGEHRDVILEALAPAIAAAAEITRRQDLEAKRAADQVLARMKDSALDLAGRCTAGRLAEDLEAHLVRMEAELPAELAAEWCKPKAAAAA